MYYYSVISLYKPYIYIYIYISHFCFQFSHDRKRKSCLFNFNPLFNLEVSIIYVIYIYIYIYYNLVTEMQAAVAIISGSGSIYNKLSFHCHVIYISKIKVFVLIRNIRYRNHFNSEVILHHISLKR